jgi:hypothetical protein
MSGNPRERGEGSHEYIERLIAGMPDHSTTAAMLRKLKRLRHRADYEMIPVPQIQDWSQNWLDAEALVSQLQPVLETL